MKKIYEELELKLVFYAAQDIITSSGNGEAPETSDDNELAPKPFKGF